MSNLLKSKFLLGLMIVAIFFVGVVALKATPASAADCTITKTLKYGMRSAEVKCLQTQLSVSPTSGYFGNLTKAAVKAFQVNNSLTADGIFGPMSRAALSGAVVTTNFPAGCSSAVGFSPTTGLACSGFVGTNFPAGCSSAVGFSPTTGLSCAGAVVVPPVVVSTGPLSVSLATTNPAGGNIVAGQAIADLAHFAFAGTGTLNQVTLQRTGISANSDLTNVYLFDGVTRVSDAASVNTAGVISFNNLNLAIAGSKTLSVRADISTLAVGTIGVTMTSYTVTGGTANVVSVKGNEMYAVAAVVAGVAVGTVSPATSTSVNAGVNNFVFWSAPVTVSQRAVSLKSIAFQLIGSAPTDALTNIKLYKNGSVVGTASAVNALGYLVFDLSAAPVEMLTGATTLEVRGDIVKGSSRTVSLALQNVSDFMVTDSQLGVNVAATGIPKAAGTVSVNSGSVTVNLDPTFSATTITGGITNATIAKYNFKAYGEDVKISYIDVTPSRSMDNVAIYANGGQVSGNIQTYVATKLHFTTGSSLIIPAGTTVSVEVKADTKYLGVAFVNATTAVSATLNGYSNNAQGMNSSTLTTVPASDQAGPSLSVGTGSLALAKTSSFVSQNIISNSANQKIGSFTVQAGSSEGVHITNLAFDLSASTLNVNNLSNMYIKYGTTTSTPINPQATVNNFPVDITLAANASVMVDVYADVGSGTTSASTLASVASAGTLLGGTASVGNAYQVASYTITTFSGSYGITINGRAHYVNGVTDAATTATALITKINTTDADPEMTASSTGDGTVVLTAKAYSNTQIVLTGVSQLVTPVATPGTATFAGASAVGTIILSGVPVVGDKVSVTSELETVTYTVIAADISATPATTLSNVAAKVVIAAVGGNIGAAGNVITSTGAAITITAAAVGTAQNAYALATSVVQAGASIIATASLSATGISSNATVASSPPTLPGQTMTIAVGTLATTATITSSSPASQFIIGGTNAQLATYNFKATNGTAIIDELTFVVTPTPGTSAPISSLTVGGVTSLVSGTSALLTNLNLSIPVSYSGLNVPVTAIWNTVGLGNQASGNTAKITLDTVKYHVGNTTTTDTAPSVDSNTMYAVASKPALTSTAVTSNISLGENKLMDITVAADAANDVQVNTLVFTNAMSGSTANIADATFLPRLAIGSTTLLENGADAAGHCTSTSAGTTVTCKFDANYVIPAGQSITFSLYGTVAGTLGLAGSTSLTTKLAASSTFSWTDVAGGSVTPITGDNTTYFLNYPTATWVTRN